MSIRIRRTRTTRVAAIVALSCGLLLLSACGANNNILQSGKGSNNSQAGPASTKPTLESDIEAMRTANFSFIYVLRRKDGGVIDPEDKSVIRTQTAQANRRVSSDDGKAVIVGSNFQIPPQSMAAIDQRFVVENYSPAPSAPVEPLPPAPNQNANR